MKRFIIGTNHLGQTRAAIPVAKKLVESGAQVRFVVDGQGPTAANLRQEISPILEAFAEAGVVFSMDHSQTLVGLRKWVKESDAVLVTMSPDTEDTTETALVQIAKKHGTPIYGYTEVPCGHNAPLWIGGKQPYLGMLDGIFAAKVTPDLRERFGDKAWEVGPKLDHLTNINVDHVGKETRRQLELEDGDPLVWFCGAPYFETILVLIELIGILIRFDRDQLFGSSSITLVVTRHARDKEVLHLTSAYYSLMTLAQGCGLQVLENSADHGEGFVSPFVISPIIPYRDILCACKQNGVVVTLHGTDGIYAPYIGVPSILCCASDYYDPVMMKEKGVRTFPLPEGCPPQIGCYADLHQQLSRFFLDPTGRALYVHECAERYPLPERPAAEIIADTLHSLIA